MLGFDWTIFIIDEKVEDVFYPGYGWVKEDEEVFAVYVTHRTRWTYFCWTNCLHVRVNSSRRWWGKPVITFDHPLNKLPGGMCPNLLWKLAEKVNALNYGIHLRLWNHGRAYKCVYAHGLRRPLVKLSQALGCLGNKIYHNSSQYIEDCEDLPF